MTSSFSARPGQQPGAPPAEAWLSAMLDRNKNTVIGRRYGFARIRSLDQFRRRVPLHEYAALEPLIRRAAAGEADVLFSGRAIAFERTAGSTGPGRLIPFSSESLEDFRRCLLPDFTATAAHLELGPASAYWTISPVCRQPETTAGGLPVGLDDAAYLGGEAASAFAAMSVVPFSTSGLTDGQTWLAITLHCLVRAHGLRLLFLWSPTFFLRLLDALEQKPDDLLPLLRHGGRAAGAPLPADPVAARRYKAYLENGDTRTLWPDLRLVDCWSHGASAFFAARLMARLPQAALRPKGLLATEGIVSLAAPLRGDAALAPTGCPLAREFGLHEFLDAGGAPHLADALIPGQEYSVLLTTSGGLYRYALGDRVRCTGFANGVPALEFLGRGSLVSDLAGEKLSDAFVAACLGPVSGFACLAVRPFSPTDGREEAGYALLLEAGDYTEHDGFTQGARIEQALRENPHYAYARRLGQLAPLEVRRVGNLWRRLHAEAMRDCPAGVAKLPSLYACPDRLGAELCAELWPGRNG